jgi:hypothetical protein
MVVHLMRPKPKQVVEQDTKTLCVTLSVIAKLEKLASTDENNN